MRRWWIILPMFALLATLARGAEGIRHQQIGHDCDGMSAAAGMDDCHRRHVGDSAQAPDCATFVCAAAQTALPAQESAPRTLSIMSRSTPTPPRDDVEIRGLRGPPDLRPPIA